MQTWILQREYLEGEPCFELRNRETREAQTVRRQLVDGHYVFTKERPFEILGISTNRRTASRRMYSYLRKRAEELLERGDCVLDDRLGHLLK